MGSSVPQAVDSAPAYIDDVEDLDRARAYPFVKWAGGKRAVVPHIVELLPKSFSNYYEPFVGGGAVFFALDNLIRKAYLSDTNQELVLAYKVIKDDPETLIKHLKVHKRKHSPEYYKKVRAISGESDPVKVVARFIYLNKTCFNGLYRVNRSGNFNVPIGRYKNPKICDEDNILIASEALKKATIRISSFEKIKPKEDDLVYCDPPYDQCYTQYTANGFDDTYQKRLRKVCDKWRDNGAYVIVSNSDTPFIRKVWKGYSFNEVTAPRMINCKGNGRKAVSELLITS